MILGSAINYAPTLVYFFLVLSYFLLWRLGKASSLKAHRLFFGLLAVLFGAFAIYISRSLEGTSLDRIFVLQVFVYFFFNALFFLVGPKITFGCFGLLGKVAGESGGAKR